MSIQEIEARYAQRIKDLEERHSADAETIARLSKERDQAIALATRTADEFAKQDINKVSNIYRQAMQLFLAGKVQDAIQLLDEDKLSRQLKAANEQEAAAKATREQVAQEWMLKGSLLTLQFRFWEADHAYKNAIGSSPGDTDATRAYAVFEENEKVYEAQTENVFKCPSPCGPHGPYPDAPIDGIPRDLPNARAWTGSSIALARQLSDLIEEGNLLVRQCLWNANIEFLGEKEIEWQAKVEQLLSPSLDPRLIEALSKVNPKQLSRTNDHNQHGIALCNSTEAETDLLTMYFNQLLGVGD
jgi:tetratricopeptide (TPR) repeat protein